MVFISALVDGKALGFDGGRIERLATVRDATEHLDAHAVMADR
jgi:hypothetical protein